MKQSFEPRRPSGFPDHLSLALTTLGVGYLPLAPGTWGSLLAVGFYALLANLFAGYRYSAELSEAESIVALIHAVILVLFVIFILAGMWAAGRSIELLGNPDASVAVVDEVMGQLVVFLFIPFTTSWLLIGAGFILFRLFDIWKPYPIDHLQYLPGGLGICADDIGAGIYAGICLSVVYALSLWI